MPRDPRFLAELTAPLARAERLFADGDVSGARDALAQFDLVLRRSSADDLNGDAARELHARLGRLIDHLARFRDQALSELEVARRTRAYGSKDQRTGRWIEDRA